MFFKFKGNAIVILVISIVLLSIVYFVSKKGPIDTKEVIKSRYKCLTVQNLVPVKAIVKNKDGAKVYQNPRHDGVNTSVTLPFFCIYFVFGYENGFTRIGTDPFYERSLWWVNNDDVVTWNSRQSLKTRRSANRKPILIWCNKEDIGNADKWKFCDRPEVEAPHPYPIHESRGNIYKISIPWQSKQDDDSFGLAQGWTSEIKLSTDADIVCLITRSELKDRIEELNKALVEIKNGSATDHPVVKILKEDLKVIFGSGLDLDGDRSIGFLRMIAEKAPAMPSWLSKQPSEIRQQVGKNQALLNKFIQFYKENRNWDERGEGWIAFNLVR